jgi:methylated-DNA-[protein]-cysteine S-methyltransferase
MATVEGLRGHAPVELDREPVVWRCNMTIHFHTHLESPIGPLTLTCDSAGLSGVYMEGHRSGKRVGPVPRPIDSVEGHPLLIEAKAQLGEYFAGERETFDLPLSLQGTPFQRQVWKALQEIPFGKTWSYGQLALRLGRPTASRAVGMANSRNPVSIVVPCHRVVGSGGALTGYAGGLERKRWLLELEAQHLKKSKTSLAG